MKLFKKIFGSPESPPRDWVATGRYKWETVKENGGMKRQQLFGEDVDLDNGEKRWHEETYDVGFYSHIEWRPVIRVVPSDTSDTYSAHPSLSERPA